MCGQCAFDIFFRSRGSGFRLQGADFGFRYYQGRAFAASFVMVSSFVQGLHILGKVTDVSFAIQGKHTVVGHMRELLSGE